MQDALLTLTQYWVGHGCLIVQPMNTEVGAGTLNPATFLRVLGPEPWRVAYVEPSVRPDDARYGENPNRIQTHTQFQVILKPEPGEAQELYLGSLAALGVDLRAHDVRFVEDNWASPALGAWGLGWEVWLDGLEITQFTYFQQAGGINLDPVSVEITYGMERILMALQAVSHFKDIAYAPGVSYGELFGQAEYEMSRYYLDDADIDANRTLFETYAREAERLLDLRLPVPAHGYVLKCSHAFNVLDARGAVSPTERARSFTRMRRLAGRAAKLWLERRAELGHPLGIAPPPVPEPPSPAEPASPAGTASPGAAGSETAPSADAPRRLLIEIGVEELPAAEVTRAAEALADLLRERLAAARLDHGEVRALASPRRVVGLVDAVSARQEDRSVRVRGPRVSAAFAEDGTPTKAAQGFARGQGVEVDALEREDGHVVAVRHEPGQPAVDVLAELLPGVVPALPAEKNMRWNAPGLSYVRPVRWLVALLGDTVVPFAVSTVVSGRTTRVLRTAADQDIDLAHADGYLSTLADHGIVVDPAARRDTIVTRSTELAAGVAGHIPWDAEAELLAEVTNLVEAPVPMLGGFDERYLELPDEVLTTVMRKHQRYLPVRSADGQLLPHFVAVANGAVDTDAVRAGNEAVLRARFEDAAFFWRADLAVPLTEFRAGLATLTFEERLGSVADRAARIAAIAAELAEPVDLAPGEREVLARAAPLAKFDLGTQMVVELSSLAGVMAREYARRAGEPEPVAEALYEMELPRHSADGVPASRVGALLSLADRFDLVAGLFAVGAVPTGSSDPFGVRRAALGLVSVLRAHPGLRVATISRGLEVAARRQAVPVPDDTRAEAGQFVVRRYERQVLDAGYEHRLVQAVLPLADAPARADETLAELARQVTAPGFAELVEALQRTARIVPPGTPADYDPTLLTEPAERRLREATVRLSTELGHGPPSLDGFVAAAAALVDPINTFFDEVLVMAEDPAVRAARLGLLATIDRIAAGVLDWSRL